MLSLLDFRLTPAQHLDSPKTRPGRVTQIRGIIFQSDIGSAVGRLVRPLEAMDQWWAGLVNGTPPREHPDQKQPPLAMHAGVLVVVEDGSEHVVEQIAATVSDWLSNGLHWTPVADFRARNEEDGGGWSTVVPAEEFRQVDDTTILIAIERLNAIRGRPFIKEDCTALIGRIFGADTRMFADSPLLRLVGIDFRSGEPAMPLLRRDATLSPEAEQQMRAHVLRNLPDPAASARSMSLCQLRQRAWISAGCALAAVMVIGELSSHCKTRKRR